MRKMVIAYILIGVLIAGFPFDVFAYETGTVTEDFSGTGRRDERATYAFWNTRDREAILPLQYALNNLGVGLKDLGGPVTAVAIDGDTLLVSGTRLGVIYRVRPDGVAENVSGSGVETPSTPFSDVRFAEVASRFSRLAQRIRSNALVAESGALTYAAGPGVYASLGGGVELSGGIIPELKGVDVRVLLPREAGALLIGGAARGAPFLAELTLRGFAPSAAVEFKTMADAGSNRYFKKARLTPEAELPEGTQVEYMLSGDGGAHFETVRAGGEHEFQAQGRDLRFRAVLATADPAATPRFFKLTIEYTRAEVENLATMRNRDNRRIADLNDLTGKLERFKRDRGVYPIADDQSAKVRWDFLGRLLIEGRYLSRMPQDPKQQDDLERTYDYISSKAGNAYVLRAKLDEVGSKRLEKDVEGKPVEPYAYEYTCDDPWYCKGKGFTVISPASEAPPEPRGTAEIWRTPDGRVYRIATVGGGPTPLEKRRVYIPRPSLLRALKNFYGRMQEVGRGELEEAPRARLVKLADKDDIYYITETFLKRLVPSRAVFDSYGNNLREVVVVQKEELDAYGESRLIRLLGDKKVWYLEGGARRHVRSPAVMARRGFKWKHVAPVNFAEYNSYPEGEPLE